MSTPADAPRDPGFIDLHTHTTESDGSLTPAELISLAREIGLESLGITDHDTFGGFEKARPYADAAGLDLVRGIELNTRMNLDGTVSRRSVHLLAYFFAEGPGAAFASWLAGEQASRRNRNANLVAKLQSEGVNITLAEVEALGRSLAGRPHFARILVDKGYARNLQGAFDRYLGEHAPTYVPRQSKTAEEVIAVVRDCGGVPVVAHPVRLDLPRAQERELLLRYRHAGLVGLEVFHSEHGPVEQAHYHQLALDLKLLPSGGSDFHGAIKPDVALGTGRDGNVRVPREFLEGLRRAAAA